jgi:hypothetical protein
VPFAKNGRVAGAPATKQNTMYKCCTAGNTVNNNSQTKKQSMPKQISPIVKLKGKIDDLSFYKSQDGFMARAKGGVSGDRLLNDPKFDQTRRAMSEFSIGGKAGKLFRQALNNELAKASDNRVASRATKTMVSILKTDTTSDFGFRRVEHGNLKLLEGFEFNNKVPFSATVKVPFIATITRATGAVSIDLVSHIPKRDIAAPENATHYVFFAAAAVVNFATGESTVVRQVAPEILWDTTASDPAAIALSLPANSPLPIFVLLGVEFVTLINGKQYPVSKGLSSLSVLKVEQPPAEEI